MTHYNKSTNKKPTQGYVIDTAKFKAKIEVTEDQSCWNWQGALNTGGYGLHTVKNRPCDYEATGRPFTQLLAHRIMAALILPITPEDYVLHKCDNKKCCNPNHLFIGTQEDNMRDAMSKGRLWFQKITHGEVREILYRRSDHRYARPTYQTCKHSK